MIPFPLLTWVAEVARPSSYIGNYLPSPGILSSHPFSKTTIKIRPFTRRLPQRLVTSVVRSHSYCSFIRSSQFKIQYSDVTARHPHTFLIKSSNKRFLSTITGQEPQTQQPEVREGDPKERASWGLLGKRDRWPHRSRLHSWNHSISLLLSKFQLQRRSMGKVQNCL